MTNNKILPKGAKTADDAWTELLQHSLMRYWNILLDCVQAEGLKGLHTPAAKTALTEVRGILPPLSAVEILVFAYYYVYQPVPPQPVSVLSVEQDLRIPALFLQYASAWQKLVSLGLLQYIRSGEFMMPKAVQDGISIVDMSCYLQLKTPASHEMRKEIFYRFAFDPESKQGKLPDDW